MIYREKDEEDVKDISTDKKRQNKYQQVIISYILFTHKNHLLKKFLVYFPQVFICNEIKLQVKSFLKKLLNELL